MATIQELKREFSLAIHHTKAAIFAGAGLSCGSGYVDWKELLRELASDIRLNVDKENDLVSVAQYYYNEKAGRGQINQKLMSAFTKYVEANENIKILARLPINTYWTTNYDKLLEQELSSVGKVVDVKYDSDNFSVEVPNSDVTVYKMHGDVYAPSHAVLTKDDYEAYYLTRQVFVTALQGDLVKKTFLFIGCSMTDPNMKYILSRIRLLLQGNQRTHYCLLKKISKKDYVGKDGIIDIVEYDYAVNKRVLEAKDLLRYGIDVVEYDDYADIPSILRDIEICYSLNNIYISGSAATYGNFETFHAQSFLRRLTQTCVENNLKITTGYGDGVGSFIISSILEKVLKNHEDLDKYLCLRPFPYDDKQRPDYPQLKYNYRLSMIKPVGIAIFVFGNKIVDGTVLVADGVWEEFQICCTLHKIIIPIGSTGFMASEILKETRKNMDQYSYLEPYIDSLATETEIDKLLKIIFQIITNCRNKFLIDRL
jgi:hypothetical protein